MKKLFLLLTVALSAFAASAQNNAKTTAAALQQAKTTGVYTFRLSDGITADEVAAKSNYYTQYFTTSFDAAKHEATITLTQKEELNRRVMQRLMVGLQVSEVYVDGGSPMTFEEVFEKHIK